MSESFNFETQDAANHEPNVSGRLFMYADMANLKSGRPEIQSDKRLATVLLNRWQLPPLTILLGQPRVRIRMMCKLPLRSIPIQLLLRKPDRNPA